MGKVQLVKSLDYDIKSKWNDLWLKSDYSHFFNSLEWFKICIKTFSITDFYLFLYISGAGDLKGLLPLVKSQKFGIKVLISPGERYLDKSTLLIAKPEKVIISELIKAASKYGNLYLPELPEALMLDEFKGLLTETSSINPYINLLLDPLVHISNKQRNSIINKIETNKNNLKFNFNMRPNRELMKTIFKLESKSFKKKKGHHIFNNKEAIDLFRNIVDYSPSNSSVNLLYFKNKPIAHMFGLIVGEGFMAYHMAYLEKYRKLVPGKILLFFLLPLLQKTNFKVFDFSRGESVLKSQFTSDYAVQYDLYYTINKIVKLYWITILLIKKLRVKLKLYLKVKFFRKKLSIKEVKI